MNKKISIIFHVLCFLALIYYGWKDISENGYSFHLVLYSLGIAYVTIDCIGLILNWKETRHTLSRIIEVSIYVICFFLSLYATWKAYTQDGDIAMILFTSSLALMSLCFLFSSFFNWKETRPKLYENMKFGTLVVFFFIFLALTIYELAVKQNV